MIWGEFELVAKQDYAAAMTALETSDQAAGFRRAFAEAFPEYTEELLGYLTGDVHPRERARVQLLLDVTHPMQGKSFSDIVAMAQRGELPAWVPIIERMPRRDWSLAWTNRRER